MSRSKLLPDLRLPTLALQSSRDPLLLVDREGTVCTVSDAAEELLALYAHDLVGRNLTGVLTRCDGTPLVLNPTEVWNGEVGIVGEGDGRRFRLQLSPLTDAGGEVAGYIGYLCAVEPFSIHDSVVRSDRFESLGRLAGSIAHDLNNILTGILGHVSYLRMSHTVPAAYSDSLRAIEDGSRRAAAMTQQIVGFARGEAGELSSVDLSGVVLAGVNLLRGMIPSNVQVIAERFEPNLIIRGDESQISQLVLNLAVNARDALPHGGVIELSVERYVAESSMEMLHSDGMPAGSLPRGTYAKLAIADNGIGIPTAVRHRIFEPFFTTKSRRGTGLGLANVVSIVRAHGGLIVLHSTEGKGTRFEVFLPASSEALPKAMKGVSERVPGGTLELNPPLSGRGRILVVDDEETVRMVMQRCLEHLGYEVRVAASGPEALARYTENGHNFDLIILDMMMPQMSGDEVFARLKVLNERVPVLIASGFASDARTRRVLDNGGLGFLQKPFTVDDLAREVRRCLSREP